MDADAAVARPAEVEQEALISGSEAVAVATKLVDVDVLTAYPIRPYDTLMQYVAKQIADGEQDAEYIVAESEHSQFEIAKHASAVGARALCGSSGVGWCYAFEAIAVTPALRLPLIAMVGNRALDDPGAFGTEHNDALAARDLGWLHVWVDTAQEALDTTLMAYRVAEDRRVYLPVAISTDGAFLTHSQSLVKVPPRSWVDKFLPPYNRGNMVFHPDNPITIAPQVNEDWLMEIRRQTDEAMRHAHGVIEEAWKEFRAIFGRGTGSPFFEEYYTDDAEIVLVGMGTLSMPVRVVVRKLREQGQKVGFVRVRWFRPFDHDGLGALLSRFRAVGVIDRDFSMGSPFHSGVLANEIRATLYAQDRRPPVVGFIGGLGGREVTIPNVREMFELTRKAAETGMSPRTTTWIGVRS
ncbi:MAG TPA: pyruvate ferredoxin oxidoreductase [bacterium]|nr:pyruvate ferredoxin oxidoreductase [bacterium]